MNKVIKRRKYDSIGRLRYPVTIDERDALGRIKRKYRTFTETISCVGGCGVFVERQRKQSLQTKVLLPPRKKGYCSYSCQLKYMYRTGQKSCSQLNTLSAQRKRNVTNKPRVFTRETVACPSCNREVRVLRIYSTRNQRFIQNPQGYCSSCRAKLARKRVDSKTHGASQRNRFARMTEQEKLRFLRNSCLKHSPREPNELEMKYRSLFKKNNIPVKYVGNFKKCINGAYPDFINEQKKIIVEVYADYWKARAHGTVDNYKRKRLLRFDGWRVFFFNDKSTETEVIGTLKPLFD